MFTTKDTALNTIVKTNDMRTVIARRNEGIAAIEYEPGGSGQIGLAQQPGVPAKQGMFTRPPDYHGAGAVGIDHAGQPVFGNFNPPDYGPFENRPYELNLVSPNASDAPFLPAHLEGWLRYYDVDRASEDQRLFTTALPAAKLASLNGLKDISEINRGRGDHRQFRGARAGRAACADQLPGG